MEWVFDTSITMAWCFDDERTAATDALLDRLAASSPAVVPQIWPLEVANVLALAMRKGRISSRKRRQFLNVLEAAPISVDVRMPIEIFAATITLADKHGLTSYDASYLELALRLGLPLATLDRELRAAAVTAGVTLL